MKPRIEGVLPALLTPFDAAEQFAPAAMERLLERLYAAGSHGVYVCGQTGEGLLMNSAMRMQAAEVAIRCSPKDKAVVIHVGARSTAEALELARHASRAGAAAISSLPPNGPYGFAEIHAYYRELAAASDVPLLVYFFPEVSAAISEYGQIMELCAIPNVIGLKFTDFDLFKMSLISLAGKVILNGRDEVFAAGLLMGAHGGIGSFYNLVPELFVEIYTHARNQKWAEARKTQDRVNRLIQLTLRFPMLDAIKTMVAWSGIDCGPCLRPRRALSADEKPALRAALEQADFPPDGFLR